MCPQCKCLLYVNEMQSVVGKETITRGVPLSILSKDSTVQYVMLLLYIQSFVGLLDWCILISGYWIKFSYAQCPERMCCMYSYSRIYMCLYSMYCMYVLWIREIVKTCGKIMVELQADLYHPHLTRLTEKAVWSVWDVSIQTLSVWSSSHSLLVWGIYTPRSDPTEQETHLFPWQ